MTTPTPSRDGMPTWLKIVLAIFLVVVLGCCGLWGTCTYLLSRAPQSIPPVIHPTSRPDEPEPGGLPTTALPANFPNDVPIFAGLRPVNSLGDPASNSGTVTLNGRATAQAVYDFYHKELAAKGWTEGTDQNIAGMRNIEYKKDGRLLQITIMPDAPNIAVMLNYSKP